MSRALCQVAGLKEHAWGVSVPWIKTLTTQSTSHVPPARPSVPPVGVP